MCVSESRSKCLKVSMPQSESHILIVSYSQCLSVWMYQNLDVSEDRVSMSQSIDVSEHQCLRASMSQSTMCLRVYVSQSLSGSLSQSLSIPEGQNMISVSQCQCLRVRVKLGLTVKGCHVKKAASGSNFYLRVSAFGAGAPRAQIWAVYTACRTCPGLSAVSHLERWQRSLGWRKPLKNGKCNQSGISINAFS